MRVENDNATQKERRKCMIKITVRDARITDLAHMIKILSAHGFIIDLMGPYMTITAPEHVPGVTI